jgi:ABC-type multidrug transport system fused ATPase/permease subunit
MLPLPAAWSHVAGLLSVVAQPPAVPVSSPASTPSPTTGNAAPAVSSLDLLRWMFRFLKPVKWLVLAAASFLTLFVIAEVMTVRTTGAAIDHIKLMHLSPSAKSEGFVQWVSSSDSEAARLRSLLLQLLALVVGIGVLRYLRETSNMRLSMTMVYYIREAVYDKLQRVGFGFHDAISTGQLINRSLSDLQNVRVFIQSAVLMTLEIVLIVSFYIVLIWTRSPWVALLALVPLPFWTFYILRFSKKVQPAAKAVMEAEDRNVSLITENIAGVHVVKAFATEKQEIARYNANCETFRERVLKRIRMFADFQPIIRSIASASHLSLFLLAGFLILTGRGLSVGDLLILGSAMGAILGRLQQVATINEQYQNAIVSARRLYEVLMAEPTVKEKPDARPLPMDGRGGVRFERVTFGYDPSKPVLHDIDFHVPPGKVVALVGPTGAGKSTLVSLIARFYDPQQGRVLIDGMDVRDATLTSLRTQVSFVFQETYLFSDTVSANIAYGRPGLSHGDIEAAARLAQAHDFIEQLPKGYDTILGERGSSLSGGQRQRLAIARAIVTNPRVLVLDDATAAIDPETEDLIRKGMRFVMAGRTTFIIAHRISTVKQADLVLVVEDGRITQQGTHDELMEQDGHYRDIAAVQLYGDAEGLRRAEEEERPSHVDRVRDEKKVSAAARAAAADAREPETTEPV